MGMCFSCLNGKHLAKDCPKGLKCSVPGCGKSHSVLLHGARGVVDSCDSCGRKKCPDERHAECPAIGAECRNCGMVGHFHRCCKNCPKLPIPMQPFPHLDQWDPRVQLQYTLTAWRMKRKWTTRCPRFSCRNCEGVLCRMSFSRGSKLLSPWHLETCPTKATKHIN